MSLEVQRLKELVNPTKFDCEPRYVRFYIVKSYTEGDVIRSVQRGLWSTTPGAEESSNIRNFKKDAGARAAFWRMVRNFSKADNGRPPAPNDGHHACVALERAGKLALLATPPEAATAAGGGAAAAEVVAGAAAPGAIAA